MSLKERVILCALLSFLGLSVSAADLTPLSKGTTLLGKPLVVRVQGHTDEDAPRANTTITSQFLGTQATLIETSISAIPESSPSAEADPQASPGVPLSGSTDLYIAGVRVWTGQLYFQNGGLAYHGGTAPVQIPFPLFAYPIGPLMVQLDAGVELEGTLDASITPGLSYPLQDSSLDLKVEAEAIIAGYIEGYASIWLLRAGAGGRIDLVEGSTGIQEFFYLNGDQPQGQYLGGFNVLRGNIYGFVDTKIFFGRWNRILKRNFFSWPGKCFAFGGSTCGLH